MTNHREMSMKKHKFRSCNAQKRTPSTDLQNCIKTRSLLSLPALLCSRHGCKNRSKSLKFYHKITTKSTNAVVAIVRNARCRSTCEHASKRVDFCRSRCCFAHAMDAKFVQNRRKSSMGACSASTVGAAAGRPGLCALLHFECPPRGGSIRSVFNEKICFWYPVSVSVITSCPQSGLPMPVMLPSTGQHEARSTVVL